MPIILAAIKMFDSLLNLVSSFFTKRKCQKRILKSVRRIKNVLLALGILLFYISPICYCVYGLCTSWSNLIIFDLWFLLIHIAFMVTNHEQGNLIRSTNPYTWNMLFVLSSNKCIRLQTQYNLMILIWLSFVDLWYLTRTQISNIGVA